MAQPVCSAARARAGDEQRRWRPTHTGRGACTGLCGRVVALVALLACACECFTPAQPRAPGRGEAACAPRAARSGRPRARRAGFALRACRAGLPLEVKECKLFRPDGSCDPEQADAFLSAYWQKQPVLLRQAFAFESPISPDELAGLALEEEVRSRIIIDWGALDPALRPPGKKDYELRVGPFTEASFEQDMPPTCYTLLCNGVAAHLPQLADLQARFNFIPNWRHDDIMISYAAEGGGVGPHVDNYDVFLLQGRGRRKWAVSTQPIAADDEEIIEGIDVRVLKGGFVADGEWELTAGDILYVPPRYPHWGTALDDECMTYSIGFRAPNLQDISLEFANHMGDLSNPDAFYQDPPAMRNSAQDPGRIAPEAVAKLWREVAHTILGVDVEGAPTDAFRRWVGGFVTQQLRPTTLDNQRSCDVEEAERIVADLEHGAEERLTRNEACKVAWLPLSSGIAGLLTDRDNPCALSHVLCPGASCDTSVGLF